MVDTVFLTGDAPDGLRVAARFFVPFAFEAAFAFAGAFFFAAAAAAEDVTAFFFTGAVFFFVAAAAEGVVVLVFAGVVVFFLVAFVFAGVVVFFFAAAAAAEGGAAFVFFFVVEFDAFLEALAIFFEDVTFLGFPPLLPPLFVVPAIVDQILALTVVYQKPYTINSIIYLLRIYVHHA